MNNRDHKQSESEWDSDDEVTGPTVKTDASHKKASAFVEIDMDKKNSVSGVANPKVSTKAEDIEEHYAIPNNPPFDFSAAVEGDIHSESHRPTHTAAGIRNEAYVFDPSVDVQQPNKKKKFSLKKIHAPKFSAAHGDRSQDYVDHRSLDSVDSDKVELVVIDNIVMEPIADNVELHARRYIREFWATIGLVLGVIIVFVTELVRMLLLRVVRPLLLLLRFSAHLLFSILCGMLYYIFSGLSQAVTPCVRLAAKCSQEVFVPCFLACRCVQVDQRHVYGETIAHLALEKNSESV